MTGHIIAQGSQFSLNVVEAVTAMIGIEDAARSEVFHQIEELFALTSGKFGDTDGMMALGIQVKLSGARFHTPEEERA
ncbi:uncharacterized protein EDB93DRAFT_1249154 [Suillus bovinus]|uniref:uncharacterized protein n=1 Tax=Suillus bovinus TaxID=48563 RepID=UPI001B864C0A|nr:uncharacterized protein EDB93DRAFT_1249154 [Suillus bovinus]KAG2152647.1 hypothetical protein EDB93DRAFT_1249154 [Suillus bovinus]